MSKKQRELVEPNYLANSGGFYVQLGDSNILNRLTNFHARLIQETIVEGVKSYNIFKIWVGVPVDNDGSEDNFTYSEERVLEVKSQDFYSGKWVTLLGSDYTTFPIPKYSKHLELLNYITQEWRKNRSKIKACTIIGFRENDLGHLTYISGNDIIGDNSGVEVIAIGGNSKISKYGLKLEDEPLDQIDKTTSFKSNLEASLQFLNLGHEEITYPLYSAIWRAPLCYFKPFPSIITLLGKTGTFKSTIAAKALSHFGAFDDNFDLPVKWIDTFAAINIQLATLHDTMVVIDDFNPEHGRDIRESMAKTLSLVIGDIGDGITKKRANHELTLRETGIMRSVVVSTNEELPELPESRLARLLVIQMSNKVSVNKSKLDSYDTSKNPSLMREYIQWLITNRDKVASEIEVWFKELRNIINTGHRRIAESYAHLLIGIKMFVWFVNDTTGLDLNSLVVKTSKVLENLCIKQQEEDAVESELGKPIDSLFLDEIAQLVNLDKCALKPKNVTDSQLGASREIIGWYDSNYIYLSLHHAWNTVNFYRTKMGKLPFNWRVLVNAFKEAGINTSVSVRISKVEVMRCCKVPFTSVFSMIEEDNNNRSNSNRKNLN